MIAARHPALGAALALCFSAGLARGGSDFMHKLKQSNDGLRRTVLDNGLVCLVKEDPSAPVVAIQIWVGSGAIHEGEFLGSGLAHYMEHMIFKGTPTLGPADISRTIDEAGGNINAYTAHDRTVFYCDLPSKNWKTGVDILADAVMHATLPEDEWEREKNVILREFAMGYDSPERVLGKLLWSTAFRVHPYRHPVIGYEDVFRRRTRDDLLSFFHQHYVPDNMIAVVIGDIDADEVEAHLAEVFKDFERRARPPVNLPEEPTQLSPRFARTTGNYEVTRLVVAFHTTPLSHPDTPALDVLADIVGEGRSSRLYRRLRDELQLVHAIDAWSHTPQYAGLFGITATFDPDKEDEVLRVLHEEIASWHDTVFTEAEIDKARRKQLVRELGSLQTMSGQAGSYGSGEYYAGNPRFSEVYLENLERVTAADLQAVVRRYLIPDNRTEVLLSPEPEPERAAAAPEREAERDLRESIAKIQLPNGTPLIVREDRRLPFVHIAAVLGGGLLSETEATAGITQLTADMLTRGTEYRTAMEIAERLDARGASLNAFSGRNSFGLLASGLSDDAEEVMATLAESLLKPSFPERELAKQKAVQLAAIRRQKEQPMPVAQDLLREALYPDHPYRWIPAGLENAVNAIDRDALLDYHRRHVRAGNLVLAVFGDISPDEAEALVRKTFAALPAGALERATPEPPPRSGPASIVRRHHGEQAVLLVGFPGIDVHDPRTDSLNILDRALSGLSSDLAIEVRDKRGLVYYIGASSLVGLAPGFVTLYAGTTAEAADEVIALANAELERIKTDGLRPEEFERAREQILAANDMSLQNNLELAQTCALHELYGLGYDHPLTLRERMAALTPEDVRQTAAGLFDPEREVTVVVAPDGE